VGDRDRVIVGHDRFRQVEKQPGDAALERGAHGTCEHLFAALHVHGTPLDDDDDAILDMHVGR
jgi:hypothetical protein